MDIQVIVENVLAYVEPNLFRFLLGLIALIVILFFVPGLVLWVRLWVLKKRISRIPQPFANGGPGSSTSSDMRSAQRTLDAFGQIFPDTGKTNLPGRVWLHCSGGARLGHLWNEYRETLDLQYKELDGQRVLDAARATVPAEVYFSSQAVVDGHLRNELFKHFPGIFTGLGIIGTFSGLITGLRNFKVSDDPTTVRGSLEGLMNLVGHAFYVSASAILIAMVVTFLSGLLLAALYRATESIAQAIDERFDAGSGAEYLSRIASASESSATQVSILKDALVGDLKSILQELADAQMQAAHDQQARLVEQLNAAADRQVAAARQNNESLGEEIARSFRTSLQEPMQAIAETVKAASGDQSANAARMLQDVMAGFSEKLNELFGGQIGGLNELNQQTARSVADAVEVLKRLVSSMEEAGTRSADAMADRMAQAIEKMEARQESINAQTAAFVEQIRKLVESSQSETQNKLQETLTAIGTQLREMLGSLSASQAEGMANNQKQGEAIAERMQRAVDSLSASMSEAVSQMQQLVHTSQSEASKSLQSTMATVGERLADMLDKLGASQASVADSNRRHGEAMATQARQAVEDLSGQVNQAVEDMATRITKGVDRMTMSMTESVGRITGAVDAAVQKMGSASDGFERNVQALGQVTTTSITQMESGAEQLAVASRDFAAAGNSVSGALTSATRTSSLLQETAQALSAGASGLKSVLGDYQEQRSTLATLHGELKQTIQAAGREAAITQDVLARIEGAAERLASVQHQTDEYLNGVSRVLGEAHEAFATEVTKTLDRANRDFHEKLSSAVSMLTSTIQELETTLSVASSSNGSRK